MSVDENESLPVEAEEMETAAPTEAAAPTTTAPAPAPAPAQAAASTAPGLVAAAPASLSRSFVAAFTRLPSEHYVHAVFSGLLTYAAAWIGALLAVILAIIGITVGGTSIDWSLAFVAPGQLVGMAVGGFLTAGTSSNGASIAVVIAWAPLFITAVIVAAGVVVSRRDERRSASASHSARWIRALVSAATFAILALLVAAILQVTFSTPGSSNPLTFSLPSLPITATSASITLVVGALVIVTLVGFLSRASLARPVSDAAKLRPIRAGVASTVPVVALYLTIAGAVILVAAIIGVVANSGVSTLWSALLWLPTSVVDGIAAFNLAELTASGSAMSFLQAAAPTAPTTAWLPTTAPAWVTILIIVINVIVIAFVGLALHMRRGLTSALHGWATTVISFSIAGALISIIGGIALWSDIDAPPTGNVLGALSALASVQLFLGPAVWTFVIFAILGALVEGAARYLAPLLVPVLPAGFLLGSSRFFGRFGVAFQPAVVGSVVAPGSAGAGPTSEPAASVLEQPAPMTPLQKKRLARILIAVGALVILVIGAFIAVSVLNQTVFSPSRQVSAYLGDLKSGDATAASSAAGIDSSGPNGALLRDSVYKKTPDRITSFAVEKTQVNGHSAIVYASVVQGGRKSTETYLLHSTGSSLVFFSTWALDKITLPSVDVQLSSGISSLDVNGAQIALSSATQKAGELAIPALPGRYTVGLGGSGKYLTATAKSATVGISAGSSSLLAPGATVTLTAKPTQAFKDAVNSQVAAYLSACAAQATLAPANCPFEEYGFGQESAVHWTISAMPTLSLEAGDDGKWAVSTATAGDALVTYRDSFFGTDVESESDDDSIYLDGDVSLATGAPVFTYTDGY
jgi:hypothetical protein